MRKASAALAALCVLAGTARAATPCTLQQVGELPITMDRGRILVDASINGTPVKMLVDTGAEVTILYRETAEKLGLRATQVGYGAKIYGAGGGDLLSQAGVKELQVGGFVAKGINLAVAGHQNADISAGLLGAGFILQTDVEFDVPEGKLRFFKPSGCAGDQVVYWGKAYAVAENVAPNPGTRITLSVKLGDAAVRATLDSGASISVVDTHSAERYADHDIATTKDGKAYGIGREAIDQSIAVFPSFSFGDETIKNTRLRVADIFVADREVRLGSRIAEHLIDEPQMTIGADFFRSHRVYISKSQKKVYVSYMGGPVFDTRAALASTAGQTKP